MLCLSECEITEWRLDRHFLCLSVLFKQEKFGSCFFVECTVTGIIYLDMSQEILVPILEEDPVKTMGLLISTI